MLKLAVLSQNSILNLGIYIFATTLLGMILFIAFNKSEVEKS